MGLLDKLAKAKEVTGGTGGGTKNFVNKAGLWVNLQNGDNAVRLGGNVVVCERHYVVDLVNPEALKSKGEGEKPAVSKNLTCLNWDIDNQQRIPEEKQCCPICDLRTAANIRRREAKEAKLKDQEDKMKDLSGKSYARSRYSWDAIDRANPNIETTDADGNTTEAPGWKILNLGKEGTEAIEALAKQYPQIADQEEGCDVVVSRHKSTRITYGASFDLDGPNINITPLTDAENRMEKIDLLRYVASHASPRAVFESLKPGHQELITDVLGKTAEDYPSEAPVKKVIRKDDDSDNSDDSDDSESMPRRSASKKTPPVRKRAASVADEFEDVAESSEAKNDTFEEESASEKPAAPKKPSPPKKPSAPKPPTAPKPPVKKEEEKPEEVDEEDATDESEGDSVHPPCFGYYDNSDEECGKCKDAEVCKEHEVEE